MDKLIVFLMKKGVTEVAFDGCHKIYTIESKLDRDQLEEYGYDFYSVLDLKQLWKDSCPLKFISSGDLTKEYIGQCETVAEAMKRLEK